MRVERVPGGTAAEIAEAARRATETLAAGGLVVHPTETVYGLGGDGSPASNELIAGLKGREASQPLILLVSEVDRLRRLLPGLEWPAAAQALAREFWPGPLTIVAPCPAAPAGLAGPGGGVAVRASPHPVVKALLARWDGLLTSSSANRSGAPPPQTLEAALDVFGAFGVTEALDVPVLAVDAGPTPGAVASTVVSLVEEPPRVLRRGPLGIDQLRRVVPGLVD